MTELLIPIGALLFDIIKKILEIRKEKKEERNKIDFFRALIQCHSVYAQKFTENALNAYIPHAVINTKKEQVLKRNVSKFSIFIPEVIEYSGFTERFPKLPDIKRHLFDFLLEFEPKSFEQIKKDYSEGVKIINKLYIYNEKDPGTYKANFINYIQKDQPPASVAPQDFNSVVVEYKTKFYDTENITPNYENQNFKYIDNMLSGLIREDYIPNYDPISKKVNTITWEAGTKG